MHAIERHVPAVMDYALSQAINEKTQFEGFVLSFLLI